MDQLKRIAANLSFAQKISLLVAILAVAGGLSWGVKWNKERDLKPLYTGLSAEDAGAVVDKLKAANIEYKVSETGGAILVPSDRVPELRVQMAASGLPKTGRLGFELFDKANFGATEFSEQVNYRRAIEGELERSVMSLAEVERARVHVTPAKDSVFIESRQPAKASVMIKLKPGAQLNPQNVMAITHLTASAVEGLSPESVSVLDMSGNLLNRLRKPLSDGDSASSDAMIEYRQAVEKDLLAKVRATLDPLLGPEKYRTGISVDCDFSSGDQSEETFDPERSVMAVSQKSEDSSGSAGGAGVPGTASNLPRPTPRPAGTSAGLSRRTENITFQTSRKVKHTKIPQGQIRRISLSVLVDQSLRWEGSGPKAKRVIEPPSPEKLKVVKDLVAGIVGLQQERGDQILVETLPFEATMNSAPPEEPAKPAPPAAMPIPMPAWAKPLTDKFPLPVLLGVAGGIILAILLGLGFLLLRRGKGKKAKAGAQAAKTLPAGAAAMTHGTVDGAHPLVAGPASQIQIPPGADPAEFEQKALAQIAQATARRDREESVMLAGLNLSTTTRKSEVLKKHITEEAKKDPAAIAQLVRTWLNEEAAR